MLQGCLMHLGIRIKQPTKKHLGGFCAVYWPSTFSLAIMERLTSTTSRWMTLLKKVAD